MTDEKTEQNKIDHLERIIENLNQHWHSIQLLLSHVSVPLKVDDKGLHFTLLTLRSTLESITRSIKELDLTQTLGEIRFIGKRLDSIEKSIAKISKDGIDQHVKLNFKVDGYSLVKEPMDYDEKKPIKEPDKDLHEFLNSIDDKSKKVLIYRYGLFGEKKHTYVEIAKIFHLSRERVRQINLKALKKLRYLSKKVRLENIKHTPLYKEITGITS